MWLVKVGIKRHRWERLQARAVLMGIVLLLLVGAPFGWAASYKDPIGCMEEALAAGEKWDVILVTCADSATAEYIEELLAMGRGTLYPKTGTEIRVLVETERLGNFGGTINAIDEIRDLLDSNKRGLIIHTAGKGTRNYPVTASPPAFGNKGLITTPTVIEGRQMTYLEQSVIDSYELLTKTDAGTVSQISCDQYWTISSSELTSTHAIDVFGKTETINEGMTSLGLLKTDENGNVIKMLEKPDWETIQAEFPSGKANVNWALYRFTLPAADDLINTYAPFIAAAREVDTSMHFLEAVTMDRASWVAKYGADIGDLWDAANGFVARNGPVGYQNSGTYASFLDTGVMEQLYDVFHNLNQDDFYKQFFRITGDVIDSEVHPDAIIREGALVINSKIGPGVLVKAGAVVVNSEIQGGRIGDHTVVVNSHIIEGGKLETPLSGPRCVVWGVQDAGEITVASEEIISDVYLNLKKGRIRSSFSVDPKAVWSDPMWDLFDNGKMYSFSDILSSSTEGLNLPRIIWEDTAWSRANPLKVQDVESAIRNVGVVDFVLTKIYPAQLQEVWIRPVREADNILFKVTAKTAEGDAVFALGYRATAEYADEFIAQVDLMRVLNAEEPLITSELYLEMEPFASARPEAGTVYIYAREWLENDDMPPYDAVKQARVEADTVMRLYGATLDRYGPGGAVLDDSGFDRLTFQREGRLWCTIPDGDVVIKDGGTVSLMSEGESVLHYLDTRYGYGESGDAFLYGIIDAFGLVDGENFLEAAVVQVEALGRADVANFVDDFLLNCLPNYAPPMANVIRVNGVEKAYVVSDINGGFEQFARALEAGGFVKLRRIAGNGNHFTVGGIEFTFIADPETQLYILGNVACRGARGKDVIDLIWELEQRCQVITLMGSDEARLLSGEWSVTDPNLYGVEGENILTQIGLTPTEARDLRRLLLSVCTEEGELASLDEIRRAELWEGPWGVNAYNPEAVKYLRWMMSRPVAAVLRHQSGWRTIMVHGAFPRDVWSKIKGSDFDETVSNFEDLINSDRHMFWSVLRAGELTWLNDPEFFTEMVAQGFRRCVIGGTPTMGGEKEFNRIAFVGAKATTRFPNTSGPKKVKVVLAVNTDMSPGAGPYCRGRLTGLLASTLTPTSYRAEEASVSPRLLPESVLSVEFLGECEESYVRSSVEFPKEQWVNVVGMDGNPSTPKPILGRVFNDWYPDSLYGVSVEGTHVVLSGDGYRLELKPPFSLRAGDLRANGLLWVYYTDFLEMYYKGQRAGRALFGYENGELTIKSLHTDETVFGELPVLNNAEIARGLILKKVQALADAGLSVDRIVLSSHLLEMAGEIPAVNPSEAYPVHQAIKSLQDEGYMTELGMSNGEWSFEPTEAFAEATCTISSKGAVSTVTVEGTYDAPTVRVGGETVINAGLLAEGGGVKIDYGERMLQFKMGPEGDVWKVSIDALMELSWSQLGYRIIQFRAGPGMDLITLMPEGMQVGNLPLQAPAYLKVGQSFNCYMVPLPHSWFMEVSYDSSECMRQFLNIRGAGELRNMELVEARYALDEGRWKVKVVSHVEGGRGIGLEVSWENFLKAIEQTEGGNEMILQGSGGELTSVRFTETPGKVEFWGDLIKDKRKNAVNARIYQSYTLGERMVDARAYKTGSQEGLEGVYEVVNCEKTAGFYPKKGGMVEISGTIRPRSSSVMSRVVDYEIFVSDSKGQVLYVAKDGLKEATTVGRMLESSARFLSSPLGTGFLVGGLNVLAIGINGYSGEYVREDHERLKGDILYGAVDTTYWMGSVKVLRAFSNVRLLAAGGSLTMLPVMVVGHTLASYAEALYVENDRVDELELEDTGESLLYRAWLAMVSDLDQDYLQDQVMPMNDAEEEIVAWPVADNIFYEKYGMVYSEENVTSAQIAWFEDIAFKTGMKYAEMFLEEILEPLNRGLCWSADSGFPDEYGSLRTWRFVDTYDSAYPLSETTNYMLGAGPAPLGTNTVDLICDELIEGMANLWYKWNGGSGYEPISTHLGYMPDTEEIWQLTIRAVEALGQQCAAYVQLQNQNPYEFAGLSGEWIGESWAPYRYYWQPTDVFTLGLSSVRWFDCRTTAASCLEIAQELMQRNPPVIAAINVCDNFETSPIDEEASLYLQEEVTTRAYAVPENETLSGVRYYWDVKAHNAVGSSPDSEQRSFVVQQ